MGNIIWLASYPKSGNTWFRLFLANLFNKADKEIDLNDVYFSPIASARPPLDEAIGIESIELDHDEIDNLRPELYDYISENATENRFMKVHDAYTFLKDGRPMFPASATKCAIYIIRNPLDIVGSYANHNSCSLEDSLQKMIDTKHCLSKSKKAHATQLKQKLLTWQEHVKSWTEVDGLNVHVMRYEDMKLNSFETFSKAMEFAGYDFKEEEIRKAIDACEFSKIKKKENETGFKEKPIKTKEFFRKGQVDSYKDELTEEQIKTIKDCFSETMKKYGYL